MLQQRCTRVKKSCLKIKGAELNPASVLKATAKVGTCALLVQQRCISCHGKAVRNVVGAVLDNGMKYKLADLRYDINRGRLEVHPSGSRVGPTPSIKPRSDAPCAGQLLPPASLDEFFQFLQCSLHMETVQHTDQKLEFADEAAKAMWPDAKAFITPNLGATERWVPYHTVLGVHELFVVESIHPRIDWDEMQKFVAMFIFRAHCKRDLFARAQLPLMLKESFWQDPVRAFRPGGPMEKAILKYRRETGQPLLTSCFRIIPERTLEDDAENLVRSIVNRTQKLIDVARKAYPVVKDKKMTAPQKMSSISKVVQDAVGLGETWAKMLTVCIDLAYPKLQLLESQCDVGTGAAPTLACLLPKSGPPDKKQALKVLLRKVNRWKSPSAKHFWQMLQKNEAIIKTKFKKLPLVRAQACTKRRGMSAVTLQVQLCEYRQFRHHIARHKYGLGDDESMRGAQENTMRLIARNYTSFDEKRGCVTVTYPRDGADASLDVHTRYTGGHWQVAARVAAMCFSRLRDGASVAEAEAFRDELLRGYKGGVEAPENSEAWEVCKCSNVLGKTPTVAFDYVRSDGNKFHFQTTGAVAGSVLQAERIARLCWVKINAGASKDSALKLRNELYRKG